MSRKEKLQQIVNENKGKLIVVGCVGASAVGITLYGKGYKAGYKRGTTVGAVYGFQKTMDWFDEEFETGLRKIWDAYREANPDKVYYLD